MEQVNNFEVDDAVLVQPDTTPPAEEEQTPKAKTSADLDKLHSMDDLVRLLSSLGRLEINALQEYDNTTLFLLTLAYLEHARRMDRITIALTARSDGRQSEAEPGLSAIQAASEIAASAADIGRLTVQAAAVRQLAEEQGVDAEQLAPERVERWVRANFTAQQRRVAWEGSWNQEQDLPQWLVDGYRLTAGGLVRGDYR